MLFLIQTSQTASTYPTGVSTNYLCCLFTEASGGITFEPMLKQAHKTLQLLHLVTLLLDRICQEFSDKILVWHKNTDSSNLNYLVKTSWVWQRFFKFQGFAWISWQAAPHLQVFHPALCSARLPKQRCSGGWLAQEVWSTCTKAVGSAEHQLQRGNAQGSQLSQQQLAFILRSILGFPSIIYWHFSLNFISTGTAGKKQPTSRQK